MKNYEWLNGIHADKTIQINLQYQKVSDCRQSGLGLYIDVLLVLLSECVCRLVQYSYAIPRAGELPGIDWLKDS